MVRPNCLVLATCWLHHFLIRFTSGCHPQPSLEKLFVVEARIQWYSRSPPAKFRCDAVGRSRQGRLLRCGGPSQSKESHADAAAIASEPSRMHTRTTLWTNLQNYRILAWRSLPNGDRRCPSHLSHHGRSNVRGTTIYSISDSQFAGSHRGRKRLSRETTRRIVLALEWPELVQIGRCKVRWLPNAANKGIQTFVFLK